MSTALLMMVMTVAIYLATLFVYRRHRRLYTTPVIVSTALIVIILLVFHLPYETYMTGGKWIDRLLGPAVVALAYPLYQFRDILKKMFVPIMTGTVIGAVVGIVSGLLLSKWAGFSDLIIHSIVPKSVTTPVAMSISESTGRGHAAHSRIRYDCRHRRPFDPPVRVESERTDPSDRPWCRHGQCLPRHRNIRFDGARYDGGIDQHRGDGPECGDCVDHRSRPYDVIHVKKASLIKDTLIESRGDGRRGTPSLFGVPLLSYCMSFYL